MNKKFSTLLAGMLLATTVGISAQTAPHPGVTSFIAGTWTVEEGINSGHYYVLTDGNGDYLSVKRGANNEVAYRLNMTSSTPSTLAQIDQALWKVTIQVTGDGGSTRFVLTNKATGYVVTFDPKNAVVADGTIPTPTGDAAYQLDGAYPNWKWYNSAYNNTQNTDFTQEETLSVVFGAAADSTMALAIDSNDDIFAYKYSNKKPAPTGTASATPLAVKINKAGSYVLSTADLNKETLVKDGRTLNYMELGFGKEVAANTFSNKYQAQVLKANTPGTTTGIYEYLVDSFDGYSTYQSGNAYENSDNYVALNLIEDDGLSFKYAHLDTAYFPSTGSSYKLYNQITVKDKASNVDTQAKTIENLGRGLPVDAFLFRFTKKLSTDEIWVEAKTQMVELKDNSTATYNDTRTGAKRKWYSASMYTGAIYGGIGTPPVKAEQVQNDNLNNRILSHCTLGSETDKVVTFYEYDASKTVNRVNLLAKDYNEINFTSIDEGVYVIKVRNNRLKDGYAIAQLDGTYAIVSNEDKIDPLHMASYQWVVEKVSRTGELSKTSAINVINREYAKEILEYDANGNLIKNHSAARLYNHLSTIQLVKDNADKLKTGEFAYYGDTLTFVKIDAVPARTASYVNLSEEDLTNKVYNFLYLNALAKDFYINVGSQAEALGKDTILTVAETSARFVLEVVKHYNNNKTTPNTQTYGYDGVVTEGKGLVKTAYYLRVNDPNKLGNNNKYVYRSFVDGRDKYILSSDANLKTPFYLKEQHCVDGTHYYALIDTTSTGSIDYLPGYSKAGVDDTYAQLRREYVGEDRTSTFALIPDETLIYRELNGDHTKVVGDVEPFTAPTVVNFYRSRIADKQYLYEDRHDDSFSEGKHINFLGVRYQGGAHNDSTAMYIDTADVRNPFIPQYMIAVGVTVEKEGKYCPIHGMNAGCAEEHLENVPAHVFGRYLINAQDSLNVRDAQGNRDLRYQWENRYTRLAFVHAMHVGDTLIVFKRGEFPRTSDGSLDYMKAVRWAGMYKDAKLVADSVAVIDVKDRNYDAEKNKTKIQDDGNYKFAFRLVNDADARDFIIESHNGVRDNETYTGTDKTTYKAVKVENGVPVIISYASSAEGVINADWWNIDDRQSIATGNDNVTTTEVKVIAAEGKVTILNASGKKVVINNILGQTIANTVLSSDNASIAAPKGIVVVAVEGEEPVKAIVK